ncbi:MAG: molybdenum cofactor biosynthesis protein MoaE [Alicyclobacillus sp.]|nr:molybdenum cofactor biosynthesis protein MoaE [Alicyclobacillus sp.]
MFVVRLFAGLAERFETRSLSLPLDAPELTVAELQHALLERFPDAADDIRSALVALNQAYAKADDLVHPDDEIALIPPVGGGAGPAPSIRISTDPLDVAEAYQTLVDARCGGVVLFCGTVREWTGDKQTTHLSYEAYAPMAEKQMRRLAEEISAQFPGVATLQWHRVGHLIPADIAVICAAAAPHRADAFTVARLLIDRLKREVPIWKKEHFADGEVTWQPNPE